MANTKLTIVDRSDLDYRGSISSNTTTEDPTFITMVIDETVTMERALLAADKLRGWIVQNMTPGAGGDS